MKRLFDLTLVLVSSPLWAPLLIAVGVLVRLKLGSPVFFRQPRPGRHGRVFQFIKFRTMPEFMGAPPHSTHSPASESRH